MYKSHLTISSTNHILSPNAQFVTFYLHSHKPKSIKWIVVYRPPEILMNKSHIYSNKLFQSTLTRNLQSNT